MIKICLYGGSFDPPHNGHVYAAKVLSKLIDPDIFYIVPCRLSPFKSYCSCSEADRMNMVKVAFECIKNVRISDFEIKNNKTSYTYSTVAYIKEIHPDSELFLLTGSDAYKTLDQWKNFEYLVKNCVFAVVDRDNDGGIAAKQLCLKQRYGAKSLVVDAPPLEVSSSDVRKMITDGADVSHVLPEKVVRYIKERGLYTIAKTDENKKMIDIEKIKKDLKLSEHRYKHTIGTEKAALELAARHYPFLDKTLVSCAALLHDFTKELTYDEQMAIFEKYGIELPPGGKSARKFFHAKTAAAVARYEYDMPDEAVSAISYHTTGKKDMTPLEKIIYLADFIEENRDDDLCVGVRNKYYEYVEKLSPGSSLDMTILYAIDTSLKLLIQNNRYIHPDTVEARNTIVLSLDGMND